MMRAALVDPSLAFRLGQLDALARTLLASPALFSPEMQHCLALRALVRAWHQYCSDRGLSAGETLVGASSAPERNAFLALAEHALPAHNLTLGEAIRTARRMAIRPLASEVEESKSIATRSAPVLQEVLEALTTAKLPQDPLPRLLALIRRFSYSDSIAEDPLTATAHTPCWAINLAAAMGHSAFLLSGTPLPFPGIVQRRLFRADRDEEQRAHDVRETLLDSLHETLCDIVRVHRAAAFFAREGPDVRSNSRAFQSWMILYGLGSITPAQLGRAIGATKAGAAKLLRQLEARQMAHAQGPFQPFVCTITFPVAFPDRLGA